MSLGAGFSAAGFSPAGFGDVDAAPAPATDNLVDEKGVQQNARAIDPATGQYILSSTGRAQGMPRVRQLVLLRIRTLLNSSAYRGMGLAAPSGDNDGQALRRLEVSLRAALADLVKAGLAQILGVVGASDVPTRNRAALRWKDLTTGQEYREPL